MMNLNKLKLIGESLKSYPLIIIIGVVGTITILLFADFDILFIEIFHW